MLVLSGTALNLTELARSCAQRRDPKWVVVGGWEDD